MQRGQVNYDKNNEKGIQKRNTGGSYKIRMKIMGYRDKVYRSYDNHKRPSHKQMYGNNVNNLIYFIMCQILISKQEYYMGISGEK